MRIIDAVHRICTSDSMTIYWDKPDNLPQGYRYHIFLDGTDMGNTKQTYYKLDGLKPSTTYKVQLKVSDAQNEMVIMSTSCLIKTGYVRKKVDITKPPFCAIGDGKTINTESIQRAINACLVGETVYIPAGVYLTGALRLHSDMELYLEEGAILQASDNPEDFLPETPVRVNGMETHHMSSIINLGELNSDDGYNCCNISIRGNGKIIGSGKQDGSGIFNLSNCQNITISNLILKNGSECDIHATYSDHIVVNNCQFYVDDDCKGDGFNVDSSTDCTVFGCVFYTAGDGITLKSGDCSEKVKRQTEHIRIFECKNAYGNGITIGREIAGGIEDVKIWDCDFSKSMSGIEIKGSRQSGGYVRNIEVKDCSTAKICIHALTYEMEDESNSSVETPVFENCIFENIKITGMSLDEHHKLVPCEAIELCGFEKIGHYLKDIVFRYVSVGSIDTKNRHGLTLQFCEDVSFEHISCDETV